MGKTTQKNHQIFRFFQYIINTLFRIINTSSIEVLSIRRKGDAGVCMTTWC